MERLVVCLIAWHIFIAVKTDIVGIDAVIRALRVRFGIALGGIDGRCRTDEKASRKEEG